VRYRDERCDNSPRACAALRLGARARRRRALRMRRRLSSTAPWALHSSTRAARTGARAFLCMYAEFYSCNHAQRDLGAAAAAVRRDNAPRCVRFAAPAFLALIDTHERARTQSASGCATTTSRRSCTARLSRYLASRGRRTCTRSRTSSCGCVGAAYRVSVLK
jgi:hypothetical protein